MKLLQKLLLSILLVSSTASFAANASNQSFHKAKKTLEKHVYQNHRITQYCGATFDLKN